jgi:hypothetical protein
MTLARMCTSLALAAVLAVLLVPAAAANSASEPVSPLPTLRDIDPQRVEEIAFSAGLPPELTAMRLSQAPLVSALQQHLREQYASVFGGLEVTREGVVRLHLKDPGIAHLDGLRRRFEPLTLEVRRADRTAEELTHLFHVARGDHRAELEQLLGGPYDVGVEVGINGLRFQVREASDRVAQELRARYGAVRVEQGVAAPDVCLSRRSRCTPIRGGVEIVNTTRSTICSTAFVGVYTPLSTPARAVLTAGHCSDLTYERFEQGGTFLGYMNRRQLSGQADAGLIDYDSQTTFGSSNWVYRQSNKQAPITSVQRYDQAFVGELVCRNGRTTGEVCGSVQNLNVSPSYVNGGSNFVLTNACSEGGDSGGSVIDGNIAVGIHSGGSSRTCPDPDDFSIYGHIEFQQRAMNMSLRTG